MILLVILQNNKNKKILHICCCFLLLSLSSSSCILSRISTAVFILYTHSFFLQSFPRSAAQLLMPILVEGEQIAFISALRYKERRIHFFTIVLSSKLLSQDYWQTRKKPMGVQSHLYVAITLVATKTLKSTSANIFSLRRYVTPGVIVISQKSCTTLVTVSLLRAHSSWLTDIPWRRYQHISNTTKWQFVAVGIHPSRPAMNVTEGTASAAESNKLRYGDSVIEL